MLDRGGKRHVGQVGFEAYQRTASFESARLYAYTDRGVYNPGQTILIRAIAWRLRGDYTPIAGEEIELHLLDEDQRIVGGGILQTSNYGTASFEML